MLLKVVVSCENTEYKHDNHVERRNRGEKVLENR